MKSHEYYMQKALTQAYKAFKKDEVPIGAVLVDADGDIISQGHNLIETKKTQMAHAEFRALAKAGKRLNDWRLNGCWLYVTLEPCAMCMNFALLSRVQGVVFGALSPKFGFQLDKEGVLSLYRRNTIELVSGICAEQSAQLLQEFFQTKRKVTSE